LNDPNGFDECLRCICNDDYYPTFQNYTFLKKEQNVLYYKLNEFGKKEYEKLKRYKFSQEIYQKYLYFIKRKNNKRIAREKMSEIELKESKGENEKII
jgi:hypothetical protein